jgi:hypothetical protein
MSFFDADDDFLSPQADQTNRDRSLERDPEAGDWLASVLSWGAYLGRHLQDPPDCVCSPGDQGPARRIGQTWARTTSQADDPR